MRRQMRMHRHHGLIGHYYSERHKTTNRACLQPFRAIVCLEASVIQLQAYINIDLVAQGESYCSGFTMATICCVIVADLLYAFMVCGEKR